MSVRRGAWWTSGASKHCARSGASRVAGASRWLSSRCWCANNSSCFCSIVKRPWRRFPSCCLTISTNVARPMRPCARCCRRARTSRVSARAASIASLNCSASTRQTGWSGEGTSPLSIQRRKHPSASGRIREHIMTDRTIEAPSKYDRLIAAAQGLPAVPTVVVHPCDESSLRGAVDSASAGIVRPVLVGPAGKIRDTAARFDLDISGFEIVDAAHSDEAASKGVELIHAAKGEMLMKGSLHTDELMRAVTAKVGGLRTDRRISHVFVMDVRAYPETLFVTDAAINIFPDPDAKRNIIKNPMDFYTQAGFGKSPRVAIL